MSGSYDKYIHNSLFLSLPFSFLMVFDTMLNAMSTVKFIEKIYVQLSKVIQCLTFVIHDER